MLLRTVHAFYGEFLQLVPLLVLVWVLLRRRGALQRIAPVLLDINLALGLLTYLLSGVKVSLWHPAVMLTAAGIAHGVSRSTDRRIVIGAWAVVLALLVTGILIAKGSASA